MLRYIITDLTRHRESALLAISRELKQRETFLRPHAHPTPLKHSKKRSVTTSNESFY